MPAGSFGIINRVAR